MLSLALVEEVSRLLSEGKLSQRKIAVKLGVSRGTVGAIASGKRGIYGREPDKQNPSLSLIELVPERCPSCGGRVFMPCLLCRALAYRVRESQLGDYSASTRRVA